MLLMALAMLGVLMFASVAYAEHNAAHVRAGHDGSPCPDPDYPRLTPDGCQASNLPDVEFGSDASPTATATASATASPTASASAAADSQYEAKLPETGGAPLALVSAVALLAGGGLLAFGIVRHR